MKALVLAGGFGTRLRPLSCTRPKLMFPIANRMLLDWILENLSIEGVTTVILAVNYMADALKREFGDSKYKMKIVYSREKKPLGTGGPIKKAENFLNRDADPFFVLNGDIISSINYSELYHTHETNKGKGTIALYQVEDPTRFGVVELTRNNRIKRFIEKPKLEDAPSKLVNAGIYVLDPYVFDIIPPESKVSIERDVFPIMAARKQLYGYGFQGLWIDTGKPDDYFLANKLVLDRIARNTPIIEVDANLNSNARVIPPSIIGKRVNIGEDSVIGPYAAIGDDVTIGKGIRIQNAILFPKAWIEKHSSINGAVIGEGALVGSWVKIEGYCIIGDYVVIDDNLTLTQHVKICHNKEVEESVLSPTTIM